MSYTVQPGDTPARIASQAGIAQRDLVLANPHKPWGTHGGEMTFRSLSVGEPLNMPVGLGARTKQPNRRGLGATPADVDSLRAQLADARQWQTNAHTASDDATKKAHYKTAVSKAAMAAQAAARVAADAAAEIGPDDVTANANANKARTLAADALNSQLYVTTNFATLAIDDLQAASNDVIDKADQAVSLAAANVTAAEALPAPTDEDAGQPASGGRAGCLTSGPEFRAMQERLNALGFGPITVDGLDGPESRAAISKFQAARGLVVDGCAGVNTMAALNAPAGPGPVVVVPTDTTVVVDEGGAGALPWIIGLVAIAAGGGLYMMQKKHGGKKHRAMGSHRIHRMLTT